MRVVISAEDFARAVEAHKRAIGVQEAAFDAARNSGRRRSPEKRAFLARIQERARRAGLEPIPAKF